MKGLLINKYIRKILIEQKEVTDLVDPRNIKALILSPTSFPFISFQRGNIRPEYTKDGNVEDTVSVEVICVANDYEQAVNIAQAVRETLEKHSYGVPKDNFLIKDMILKDSDED